MKTSSFASLLIQSRWCRVAVVLGMFLVGLGLASCSRNKTGANPEDLLVYLLQNQPGVNSACQQFFSSELLCTTEEGNPIVSCDTQLERFRGIITPADKRTDTILELYFRCFTKCNNGFNLASNCINRKFTSLAEYRRAQRNTTIGADVIFASTHIVCMQECRNVDGKSTADPPGLSSSGSRFPQDPFP